MFRKIIDTPFGEIEIVSDGKQLTYVNFIYDASDVHTEIPFGNDELLTETEKQLGEYFNGTRKEFNLPLEKFGTEFQNAVFKVLSSIPYGEYFTYKRIAEEVGSPKSFRAVGEALRKRLILTNTTDNYRAQKVLKVLQCWSAFLIASKYIIYFIKSRVIMFMEKEIKRWNL